MLYFTVTILRKYYLINLFKNKSIIRLYRMSSFTENVTDCLVLKLEEVERNTNKIDTTAYIIYDKKNHRYLIRGRRRWTPVWQSCTYSFECEFAKDLADFIQYLICPDNRVNEVLYNYNNLPEDPNEITFEFLNEYDHADYEISGYNKKKLRRPRLLSNLRMLRNVFNYY